MEKVEEAGKQQRRRRIKQPVVMRTHEVQVKHAHPVAPLGLGHHPQKSLVQPFVVEVKQHLSAIGATRDFVQVAGIVKAR